MTCGGTEISLIIVVLSIGIAVLSLGGFLAVRALFGGSRKSINHPHQNMIADNSNLLKACPKCGHIVKATYDFCLECGAKL